MLHKSARIGGRTVGAVEVAIEYAQKRGLLSAVVRGVGDAPHHDPRARSSGVKETGFGFPPRFIFEPQRFQPGSGVARVLFDEADPRFRIG